VTPPRALVGVLYGLTLAAVFTIAASSLTYFDFWWYLASAERIVATRSVPGTDPFSYTAEGQAWINHMWASQLLFHWLWTGPGRVWLLILKSAAVTATFAIVLVTIRRRGVHPVLASLVVLAAAWAGWEYWDVRPQIVTYLLLAVYLFVLRDGWERRGATLAWLPVLMVPWANLHAGFVTGFGVVGLVGAATAVPRLLDPERRADGWRVVRLTGVVLATTALASLVNPYGVRAILFPLEVVNTRTFMAATAEWFSPNFHNPAYRGFEVMLLSLFPVFAWGRARLGAVDVLLTLTFTHLGLASARHIPLFAVAVAPVVAVGLEAAWREAWDRRPPARAALERLRSRMPTFWPTVASPATHVGVVIFLIVVSLLAGWTSFADPALNPFWQDLNERRYPERTMAFIKAERLPAPLFNAYAWGGYELWRLYPDYRVFIDGRTHVYGTDILQDFVHVSTLGTRWSEVLERWGIQTILTERRSSLTQVLKAVGGWRLVFAEVEAAVFVRDVPAHRALLARLHPVTLSDGMLELRATLRVAIDASRAGDDDKAARRYREVLSVDPEHPVALLNLAIIREKQGDTAEARSLYGRVVELYPDSQLAASARARLGRR
jgi:tetratricopeptide (TPR) repeat protein